MKTEYEARKLDISTSELIEQLKSNKANLIGCFHQKRYVYDFIPPEKGHWIRLRTNGNLSTLAIKEIVSKNVDGTKELEIIVSNFEDTNTILSKLGFLPRSFQENFRVEYELDNVKLDIDKWPMIPPFLEIEGDSIESIYNMLVILRFNNKDITTIDVDSLYREKYNIELDNIPHLTFTDKELIEIERIKSHILNDKHL
ncbi:MAG: hypothetical protein J6B01_10810 [Ruminococcus sp.]|nr:hypothetical protein [Ruminococcus sp.]